ncbi:methyltransferase domain-containing protein [Streptomyces sp. NPDC003011]
MADARALPVPDAVFDVAVSGLVPNIRPQAALAAGEAARAVRPGGLIAPALAMGEAARAAPAGRAGRRNADAGRGREPGERCTPGSDRGRQRPSRGRRPATAGRSRGRPCHELLGDQPAPPAHVPLAGVAGGPHAEVLCCHPPPRPTRRPAATRTPRPPRPGRVDWSTPLTGTDQRS